VAGIVGQTGVVNDFHLRPRREEASDALRELLKKMRAVGAI